MAEYLLDSDVLIWALRGREETVSLLENLQDRSDGPLACSALSVMEVSFGVRSGEEKMTRALLDALDVLPVTADAARRAADLLRHSKKTKNPRDWVDALIAATCLLSGATLVTYNRKDYPYLDLTLYPIPIG